MKRQTLRFGKGFRVALGNRRAQAAEMVERGDTHEVRNTGRTLLKTLSVYVPPAYTKGGDEPPRGRR
jgi:hypothetical protein